MIKLPDHVGLDFGTHSVKAVELKDIKSNTPTLVNFGSQSTPQGVINSEDSAHQKLLSNALKELFLTTRIKNKKVVIALPEFSVFTRFIEFVGIKEEELQSAVYYEAKQYISIPIEGLYMDFIVIGLDTERNAYSVLLVAAPKKIVDIYMNVVSMAGLETIAIETESIAMGRAMFRSSGEKQLVMLDFGANNTDMSIMNNGNLVFSQSIAIGSDSLTQAIVNAFNLEYTQAEEYKRNYGLIDNVLEGKVALALKPIMDSILTEVQRGVEFYKSRTLGLPPTKYLLNGDGALLPGLSEYISKGMGVEAFVANPWDKIFIPEKFKTIIDKSKPSFSVAIGLSLKNE